MTTRCHFPSLGQGLRGCGTTSCPLRRLPRPIKRLLRSDWTPLLKLPGRGVASKNIYQKVLICDFVHHVPSHDRLLVWAATGFVWAATEHRPSSPTDSMKSLVASTEPNDSDGDEATEPDDSDTTIMIDDSETGEICAPRPPSPTNATVSDHGDTDMVCEHDHAETGETVMALVPCKRFRGHFCFVPVTFYPNPAPEKRKVRHCISTICEKQMAELV